MKRRTRRLPGLLAEIAEVVGEDAAIAIAEAKGGLRAVFPTKVNDKHWLVAAVGREAAEKLCAHFRSGNSGQLLMVPLGPAGFYGQARRRALRLRADGMSIGETARLVGVSVRAVEKWTAAARAAGSNQLFGGEQMVRGNVRPSPDRLYSKGQHDDI